MELKNYQKETVSELVSYLDELKNSNDADTSFYKVRREPYKQFKVQTQTPFVCIKIPTGGGKTFVATHCVTNILDKYYSSKRESGVVVWFVPSEAIKSQTIKKLKQKKDPHREVLDKFFNNRVKVFSNEEALSITATDVRDNVCIIVAMLDAFRKETKDKYKVYQENGALIEHFQNIDDNIELLDKDEKGQIVQSLANLIALNNPLTIIDEGHRAKTALSWETLRRLNPSFVLEFTATPRTESNVLVNISSSQLKEEHMVKIPIFLESASQWQKAVDEGVYKLSELASTAKKERGEYIRPIALIQAQQEKEDESKIYVEKILKYLTKDKKIPREQIAIKTSKHNEIEDVDLFSKKCPIQYIITVNALGEGWDCSFAYVLISVANIGSKVSVEQLIGRVMRLPNAKVKKQDPLNYSYVFASAKNFKEAADAVVKGVEEHGFSREDILQLKEKPDKRIGTFELNYTKEFSFPLLCEATNEDRELLFGEDLIGESYDIAKESSEIIFKREDKPDALVKLDIKQDEGWTSEIQTRLNFIYLNRDFSEKELINWLDKKLRYPIIDQKQKRELIKKIIKHLSESNNLSELSVGRYILQDRIKEHIDDLLSAKAKTVFDKLNKAGKIICSNSVKFEPPKEMTLYNYETDEFEHHVFKKAHKMNKEELDLAYGIDGLDNTEAWYRNIEKVDFYIQGWKSNKFCPDFLLKTKKGNFIVLEYKGADRKSNEDTKYKEEIGKLWAKIAGTKYHFFLVTKDTLQDVLGQLKDL